MFLLMSYDVNKSDINLLIFGMQLLVNHHHWWDVDMESRISNFEMEGFGTPRNRIEIRHRKNMLGLEKWDNKSFQIGGVL